MIYGYTRGTMALPVREGPQRPDLAADPTRPRMRAGARPRKERNQDEGCQADGVEVRGNPDSTLKTLNGMGCSTERKPPAIRAGPREGPKHQGEKTSQRRQESREATPRTERAPLRGSTWCPFPFQGWRASALCLMPHWARQVPSPEPGSAEPTHYNII